MRRLDLNAFLIVFGGSGASALFAIIANWMAAGQLGPAQYGLFSLAFAIMTLVQEIGGPALDTAIVRFATPHIRTQPLRAEAYFRAGFWSKLVVSLAMAGGLVAFAGVLSDQVYQQPVLKPALIVFAACLVAANMSTFQLARLQASEAFVSYSLLRTLSNVLKVLLLALIWVSGRVNILSVATAWTLSFIFTGLAGAFFCRPPAGSPSSMPEDRPYRDIAGFAKWTMLSGLLFAVHMRTDVLLLGHYWSSTEVGYYAIATNLMLVLDLITSSIVVAFLPKASRLRSPAEIRAFRLHALFTSLAVAVALLPIYIFAATIIETLFPAYLPGIAPFRILFWSSIIILIVYPLYLSFYAQNKPAKVSITYAVLALSSIVVGLLIIPEGGIIGAAETTLIARAIGAIVILYMIWSERAVATEDVQHV